MAENGDSIYFRRFPDRIHAFWSQKIYTVPIFLCGQALLPVDLMNPLIIWLASTHSDGVTGCRFVGWKWVADIDPDEAAQGAREEPVFHGQEG